MNYSQYLIEVEELNHHAYLYYCLDSPVISDSEYDIRYRALLEFEADNPNQIHASSPTQRIGNPVVGKLTSVKHSRKLYSLDNAFNLEDLINWVNGLGEFPIAIQLDPKYDGLAITASYSGGNLTQAATRGDGLVGEDVTHNFKVVHGTDMVVSDKITEIRGEIVMSTAAFERLNVNQKRLNKPLYANQRNAAAGSMRQLDPKVAAERNLMFCPYEIFYMGEEGGSLTDRSTISMFTLSNIEDVKGLYDFINRLRDDLRDLPYMTDGIVLKVVDDKRRHQLGFTAKFPKGAIAFKFPEEEVESFIKNVEDQVGRTGLITPRADIDPVFVAGVTVSSATLHNYREIERLGVMIGDVVKVKRAGEVIPKVTSVVYEKRNWDHMLAIVVPTRCPSCGGPVAVEDDGILLRCISGYQCPAQRFGRLIHFVSRKCMDMDGLGEERIADLIDANLINTPDDLFALEKADRRLLLNLPRMTDAGVTKLLEIIASSKRPPLDKLINALSIRGVSEETSKDLAKHFRTLEAFLMASLPEVLSVKGVGPKTANWIMTSLNNESTWMWALLGHGVDPLPVVKTDSKLEGKTFVITGTFSHDREDIKAKLELMGAKVSSSVSAKTYMVLAGANAGSKLTKAQELGVRIGDSALVEFIMTHDDLSISIF